MNNSVKFPDDYSLEVMPDLNRVIYIFKDPEGNQTNKFRNDEPLMITNLSSIGKEIKRHIDPKGRLSKIAIAEEFEYFKMALNEICEDITLQKEREEEESEEEKELRYQENLEKAIKILQSKELPLLYISSLFSWQTAGERSNITLAFICYCSQAILRNPISVIGLGEGASGKSHIQDTAELGLPYELLIKHKSITEAAFFEIADTNQEYYDGKIVDFGDLGGKSSQDFVLEIKDLLKELQSDGYLSKVKMVPGRDGGYIRKKLELHGNPCVTYTTVPNHEFDDQELSRSVFFTPRTDNRSVFNERKKLLELRGRIYKSFQYYTSKLEIIPFIVYVLRNRMEDIRIINPYTDIVFDFLGESEFFKRDFDKYNGILKTITAFNGYNRGTFDLDGENVLFTSLDDVQLFMSLLEEYHESIMVNITPKAAEILNDLRHNLATWIYDGNTEEAGITTTQYLELTDIPMQIRSVQRYFGELNRAGFLVVEGKKGKNNIYNVSGKKSAFKKKERFDLNERQIGRITREIGDAALRFIQEDERHDVLNIFYHDPDIDKPEWEFEDYEKYQGR